MLAVKPRGLGCVKITALPASRTVPTIGQRIDSGAASLALTGDTGPDDDLWR
ncbi:hypothetical protein LJR267_002654 [Paraburkholderia hospita]|uniref:hypothetical protein n=1 Tax=Paraburkholderia hospita TaxID=169430 RepID=UPI003ECF5B71